MSRALFHMEADIAAYHHTGKLFGRSIFCFHGADILALAQNGASVCHSHDLL